MNSKFRFYALMSVALFVAVGWFWSATTSVAADKSHGSSDEEPVEPDMHEFMEYVFQPTYKRLKPVMAQSPEDNAGWKSIKSDALILAEGGNLLLIRQPEDDAADWVKHSVQVRDFGGQLYRAAKAKDFTAAWKQYEKMIENCNACHQQFAGGEHMLKP